MNLQNQTIVMDQRIYKTPEYHTDLTNGTLLKTVYDVHEQIGKNGLRKSVGHIVTVSGRSIPVHQPSSSHVWYVDMHITENEKP